jgi:hypothetical protein
LEQTALIEQKGDKLMELKPGVGLNMFPGKPSPFRVGIGSPLVSLGVILDEAKRLDGNNPERPNYRRVERAHVERYDADFHHAKTIGWSESKNEPIYLLDNEGNKVRGATMDAEWASNTNPHVLDIRFKAGLLGSPMEYTGIPTWEEITDYQFNPRGHFETAEAFSIAGVLGYSKDKPRGLFKGDNLLYDLISAQPSRFGGNVRMPPEGGFFEISFPYTAKGPEDEWKEFADDSIHGGKLYYVVAPVAQVTQSLIPPVKQNPVVQTTAETAGPLDRNAGDKIKADLQSLVTTYSRDLPPEGEGGRYARKLRSLIKEIGSILLRN